MVCGCNLGQGHNVIAVRARAPASCVAICTPVMTAAPLCGPFQIWKIICQMHGTWARPGNRALQPAFEYASTIEQMTSALEAQHTV